MPKPLEVTETGDRMVFSVTSERNPRVEYTVDLLENGGIGTCTCKGFQTTTWPKIRDGKLTLEMPHPDKHITAARMYFLRQLLSSMAATESTAPHSTVSHGRR